MESGVPDLRDQALVEMAELVTTWGASRSLDALSRLFDERFRSLRQDGEHDAALALFEAARVLDYQSKRVREASL